MNASIVIDYKSITAIGLVIVGVVLACKMDADKAEGVLIHAIDAFKGRGIARLSDR